MPDDFDPSVFTGLVLESVVVGQYNAMFVFGRDVAINATGRIEHTTLLE